MSLALYKKKRDFKKTPEPVPLKSEKQALLRFVVQRHDASHLHYDFRLELEGVLKSWAIPKGPSMIAGEKRLAIMVEDHPSLYGEFYGEIAKGNYGAGTVEIWDEGTYKPLEERGDPEKNLLAQLEKGDLKFVVSGHHLKGAFALVRLKDGEKQNEWLLIKKKDQFAQDNFDIEKVKPLKSTIKKGTKSPKQSFPGVSTPLDDRASARQEKDEKFPDESPKPMLAKLSNNLIDNPSWLYEMKYDGYRLIASINEGKVEMVSRNGNSFNQIYGKLTEELSKISDNVILDGELVIENSRGLSDFQLLQNYRSSREGALKYYVFDILYLNGHSIINFPLVKRKELLEAFFGKYKLKGIYNSPYQVGNGKALFEKLSQQGYEGIIAKAGDSAYLPGKRADTWLKVKATMMQEAIICGYTLPQNSRKYFGSLILGLFDEDGVLKYIGNCGTGFNETSLRELHSDFEALRTETSPFVSPPKLAGTKGKPVWLRPELVCNVKFLEWSREEHMRNPVFMGLRIDKDAKEVVNESKSDVMKTSEQAEKNTDTEKTIAVSGQKVKCTNLTKVYWPDEGYTKGDLIAYYQGISKYILPYLVNRPQSLNRHPNGITGKSFYQKDMDINQLPSWVKTVKIYSKSNEAFLDYLICDDAATLIFMANLGCIEINPWHSTYLKPDEPTYIILDLDPGDIAFTEVVNTALVIKEICDEIKISCYCKTSGATGLHVYIPFGARYNYDQVKTFAEIIATIAHNRLPSTTSIERSVQKRKDKIYIDFLQNSKGQTIAAPYSVRPRPLATVSTPLDWKEVNAGLTPEMFTIKNTLKRLDKVGDLWQPVIKKDISLDKTLKALEKVQLA